MEEQGLFSLRRGKIVPLINFYTADFIATDCCLVDKDDCLEEKESTSSDNNFYPDGVDYNSEGLNLELDISQNRHNSIITRANRNNHQNNSDNHQNNNYSDNHQNNILGVTIDNGVTDNKDRTRRGREDTITNDNNRDTITNDNNRDTITNDNNRDTITNDNKKKTETQPEDLLDLDREDDTYPRKDNILSTWHDNNTPSLTSETMDQSKIVDQSRKKPNKKIKEWIPYFIAPRYISKDNYLICNNDKIEFKVVLLNDHADTWIVYLFPKDWMCHLSGNKVSVNIKSDNNILLQFNLKLKEVDNHLTLMVDKEELIKQEVVLPLELTGLWKRDDLLIS